MTPIQAKDESLTTVLYGVPITAYIMERPEELGLMYGRSIKKWLDSTKNSFRFK